MRRFLFGLMAISALSFAAGCERERNEGMGEELREDRQGVGEELREEGGQFKEGVEDRTED